MYESRIDYFAPPETPEEACLKGIKGEFRRRMIAAALAEDDLESIPPVWRSAELTENVKIYLMTNFGPHALGGEDLPDLEEGEVEIARLVCRNSVHGEVTSLRARRDKGSGTLRFRLVDEYGTDYVLPRPTSSGPLTVPEILATFHEAEPCPVDPELDWAFSSSYYLDLAGAGKRSMAERWGDDLQDEMGR